MQKDVSREINPADGRFDVETLPFVLLSLDSHTGKYSALDIGTYDVVSNLNGYYPVQPPQGKEE